MVETNTKITLKQFFMLLCTLQNDIWENDDPRWFDKKCLKWERTSKALKAYHAVYAAWKPITYDEIEYQFDQPEFELKFFHKSKVIYLPPLIKDPNFVPILSPHYKFNTTQSMAQLKVMLVCFDETKNERPYGIGFRMESPEILNQNIAKIDKPSKGHHDFYHAQLSQKFCHEGLNHVQIELIKNIPQSQPSFPLPANCPVTLLLCLIVTLYGGKCYYYFFNKFKSKITGIEPYLEKLKEWVELDL